jgi:hypothetical protein
MDKVPQKPDTGVQRAELANRKVAETVVEAVVGGLDPFLCIIILQTFSGLTVRSAGDSRIVSEGEKLDVLMAKIKVLVAEYCSELPGVQLVPGSGPS